MSETLEQQAVQAGIDLGYHDINGTYHATKPEVLESIVAVLDKSKPDSGGLYHVLSLISGDDDHAGHVRDRGQFLPQSHRVHLQQSL